VLTVLHYTSSPNNTQEGDYRKPERLKYLGDNVWSRRITQEHRLVYTASREQIDFLQARYHYK